MTTEETKPTDATTADAPTEAPPAEKPSTEQEKPSDGSAKETKDEPMQEDAAAEAQTLLATGKRHLLCGEINQAIESLQTACQLLSETYGEMADECGQAYFFYGKARLELARMEPGVFTNALTGVPEEGDTEEEDVDKPDEKDPEAKKPIIEKYDASKVEEQAREDLAAQVYDAMAEKEESEKQDGEQMEKTEETAEKTEETEEKTEEKPAEDAEKEKSEENKETEGETEECKEDEEEEDGEEEEGEEEKEEEDVSNLQLAWETIDLARVIFSRHDTKEMQLRTAQAHLKLGEISVELENYDQAVKDFYACLELQRKYLSPDDRLIAESCYQLGVALSYDRKYTEAREHLRKAQEVVTARQAHLQKIIDEAGDDNKKVEEKKTAESELKELSDIIPDIEAKIKDTEDEEKELATLVKEAVTESAGETSTSGFTSSSTSNGFSSTSEASSSSAKPVNVLVPRKRKASDDVSEQTKKQRAENGDSNGTAHPNGDSNGTHANGDKAASNGQDAKTEEKGSGDAEVKVKSVDEVLEKKAEADAAMDTA